MLRFYLSFNGRASRRDYWLRYYLPIFVLGVVVAMLDFLLAADTALRDAQGDALPLPGGLSLFFWAATLWPATAVTTKRLHDRGKSGWSMTLPFALLCGSFAALVAGAVTANPMLLLLAPFGLILALLFNVWLLVQVGFLPGDRGENAYGADPLTTPGWSSAASAGPAWDTSGAINAIAAAARAPDAPLPQLAKQTNVMRHQPPTPPGASAGGFGKRPGPRANT